METRVTDQPDEILAAAHELVLRLDIAVAANALTAAQAAQAIAGFVRAQVEREREACARIVEESYRHLPTKHLTAQRIRQRGQEGKP